MAWRGILLDGVVGGLNGFGVREGGCVMKREATRRERDWRVKKVWIEQIDKERSGAEAQDLEASCSVELLWYGYKVGIGVCCGAIR